MTFPSEQRSQRKYSVETVGVVVKTWDFHELRFLFLRSLHLGPFFLFVILLSVIDILPKIPFPIIRKVPFGKGITREKWVVLVVVLLVWDFGKRARVRVCWIDWAIGKQWWSGSAICSLSSNDGCPAKESRLFSNGKKVKIKSHNRTGKGNEYLCLTWFYSCTGVKRLCFCIICNRKVLSFRVILVEPTSIILNMIAVQ